MKCDFNNGCTIASVVDGYDAFLLGDVYNKTTSDILYVVSH